MNWELFSTMGYVSVALWISVPLLWLLHQLIRPRRWLAHLALGVSIAAFVLASVHSRTYIGRIQVDRSDQIEGQMSRQALARQAAEQERSGEVAQIRFAEDASSDFLDTAGLDDADLEYFQGFDDGQEPAWKREKKARSTDASEPDDLESLIGASEQREGVEVAEALQQKEGQEPILMSDADKLAADRLDKANLVVSRSVVLLALLFVGFDYVRRLNSYNESYFPLPLPSAWADELTPRTTVQTLADKPRRSLLGELKAISRRGEVFVLLTDDPELAQQAKTPMPRLPGGFWPIRVLDADAEPAMDDTFVFETLWFARHSFVVQSPERVQPMLERFIALLSDRIASRAKTRRAVHVVWDLPTPIPGDLCARIETLGRATGFTLLIHPRPAISESDEA